MVGEDAHNTASLGPNDERGGRIFGMGACKRACADARRRRRRSLLDSSRIGRQALCVRSADIEADSALVVCEMDLNDLAVTR